LIGFLTVSCAKEEPVDKQTPTTQDPLQQAMILNPALSRSGALVVASDLVEGLFNPLNANNEVEKWINSLVFDSLLTYDDMGNLETRLAETYEISEDGLSIVLNLAKGVTFHDGSDLTAKDVAFTYNLAKTNLNLNASLDNLNEVVVLDDYSLEFKFDGRRLDQFNILTIPILSLESYGEVIDWNTFVKPVGTGMFRFETFVSGESIVLIRNVSYWGKNANISGIIIRQMNPSEMMTAFSEGRIDLFKLPASKAMVNDVKALGFGNVLAGKSNIYTFLGLNMRAPIFAESEVRKALLFSLNRELLIINEWNGYADQIDYLATGIGEFNKGTLGIKKYPYNMEIAETLLDEIGWIDSDGDGIRDREGENLSFAWLVFVDLDWSYRIAEQASKNWRALGFDVKIEYMDFESMLKVLETEHSYDMWNMAYQISEHLNPEVLFGKGESRGIYNFGGYDDIVANQIFNALNETQTRYDSDELLTQWHLLQTDELPYLPVARLRNLWAYNNRVKNLSLDFNGFWAKNLHLMEINVLQ
jgi:peptide/nickel transport system substrate-binding protein